ncbi:MAG: hypothetical protein ACLQU1_14620 [Bryobacteraceae bacterium]
MQTRGQFRAVTVGWFGSLAWLASLTAPGAQAQFAKPPEAYSVTEVSAMMGPSMAMKIDRDGAQVVVESTLAPPAGGSPAPASHTRTYYDLRNHKNYTLDLGNPSAVCSRGDFSGDWGDPFEMSAGLMKELAPQNPRQTGSETVNGFATKVMETAAGPDKAKVWIDKTSGLVVKAQVGTQTVVEIKRLSLAKPAAALFALPAKCGAGPPTEAERIAAETGGNAGDFANAMMTGGSRNPCSVLLRVVRAGTMQPIISGFQVAIDTTVNPDHPPAYSTRESADGHATFSGGALHEVTAQLRNGALRIDNAPPQFHLETYFGTAGDASALIYRNCVSPQTVLLLVVKNPAKITDGADWLWVKSGKFAAGN